MNIQQLLTDGRGGESGPSDDLPSTRRRRLLGSIGTVVSTTVAGCSGGYAADEPPTATPPTPTERSLALPSVVTRGGVPDGRVELRPEGSVTLLNFFATWCKPCREEMPDFRRLRAEYDPDSLHMVSITPEVDETLIREFWEKYGGTWPVVTDPSLKTTEKWDANSYPTNLLFDRDGDPTEGDSPEIRAREFSELKSLIDPLIEESK